MLPADQVIGSAIRLRVQARVKGSVDSYNPEVVISYATSQRKTIDDDGNTKNIDDDGNGHVHSSWAALAVAYWL